MGIARPKRRSYRWPAELARLVGRWEAERLRTLRPSVNRLAESLAMERIWAAFPKKTHPRQLRVTDVEDYKLSQRKCGRSPQAIRRDLATLHTYYNWLRRELGMELDNPVILPPRSSRRRLPTSNQAPLLPPESAD